MRQLQQKIKEQDFVFGIGVGVKDPQIIEMVAYAGFDFVFVDFEHSVHDLPTLENMIRAAEVHGLTSMVRVPPRDFATSFHVAEIGANGVILPHLSTKEDAQNLVNITKYAPIGKRGVGGSTRVAKFGTAPITDVIEQQNANFMTTGLIENKEGYENIDEILSVEGLDMLHIGIGDLSFSMGIAGQYDHPDLQKAVEEIAEKATAAGVYVCVPTNDAFPLAKLKELNVHVIQTGLDTPIITRALANQLQNIKEKNNI